jgi:hypothetical protein
MTERRGREGEGKERNHREKGGLSKYSNSTMEEVMPLQVQDLFFPR